MNRNERRKSNSPFPKEGGRKQQHTESDPLKQKIEAVKNVTGWPDEDIVRVLEKCNLDAELAISNILDGFEPEPNRWNEVHSRRSKAEFKASKQEAGKSRQDNKESSRGNRASRKPSDSKEDRGEKIEQRKRNLGPKNNHNSSENGRDTKEAIEASLNREAAKTPSKDTSPIPASNLSTTTPKIPSAWDQKRLLSEQIFLQSAAQQREQQSIKVSKSEGLVLIQHKKQQSVDMEQQTTHNSSSLEQHITQEISSKEEEETEVVTYNYDKSYSPTINSSRQYHPPGMNKTWKPKEGAPSKASNLTSTDTLVDQLVNNVPSSNTNLGTTTHPINSIQQTYNATPVILPTVLQDHSDAQDVLFGNFSGEHEEKSSKKISSQVDSVPREDVKTNQVSGSNAQLRISQQDLQTRVENESHPQVHIPSQPGAVLAGYGGYLPRPGHFAMPPYGAHFQNYDSTDVHYGYEGISEAQAMQMRQPMVPYEGQQGYQPSSQYQREASPTTEPKYIPGTASRSGDNVQNTSTYRDNKFSQEGNTTGTQPPTGTAQGHAATQGSYGYPMYTYAPYGIPNQYTSSQYPQHQQYATYHRYYRPTPYPNYSGNVNTMTAGYPNHPGPTGNPSSNIYTEDMVQEGYKNMFPGTPFFHSGETNLGNIVGGKQTPSGGQSTSVPSQQGSKQSYSNTQSVNSQQGNTSPDLSSVTFKNQQQQQASFQNSPRETSAPATYYNMAQQQYGQQTSTSFPYMPGMHNVQQPQFRGQQQYQS